MPSGGDRLAGPGRNTRNWSRPLGPGYFPRSQPDFSSATIFLVGTGRMAEADIRTLGRGPSPAAGQTWACPRKGAEICLTLGPSRMNGWRPGDGNEVGVVGEEQVNMGHARQSDLVRTAAEKTCWRRP